jgi:integrase
MASKFVNQLSLDNGIRPPKTGATVYRVKHCKGLYLRVSATAACSWSVFYRVDGKLKKETLGRLRDIPRVEDAVKRARASQDLARAGRDPVAERRGKAAKAVGDTLEAAVERYLADHVERNLRPGSIYNYERLFRHDVLPRWGDRPIASITKADVLLLLNDKATAARQRVRKDKPGGPVVQANRILARLTALFRWAIAADLVAADPTVGVRPVARERPRDRFLSDAEVGAFWKATNDGSEWSALFRILLLTGQRRSEVGGMRWGEINLDERLWTIPAERAKNNKSHLVHLSALALAQLQGLPRDRDRLFTAASFSRAKARIDEKMGVSDWVTHDLRRTATTLMAQLGVPPHVADKVLNHQGGIISGLAATYNRFSYIDERKAALERLGEHIAKIVGENVIELPKRA